MRHKMIRVSFIAIALGCIAFFIMGMAPENAENWGFRSRGLCGLVGTWQGEGEMGFNWMAVFNPGQGAINGQVTVEWVELDPTLGNPLFNNVVSATNACGVWKKVGWRTYQLTWMAHGLDQNGMVVYTVRCSGEAELVDCDFIYETHVLELWLGLPQDPDSYTNPILCIPGTAFQTRMQLVQATVQPSCLPPAPPAP